MPDLLYVQRDQPQGVPPLSLTGERTLPDVPEENYWFRRHLVGLRVDRGARARPARRRSRVRGGLRVGRARPHRGVGRGRGRQSGGVRARAPEVHRRPRAVRAQHARAVDRGRGLRRVPADDRARAGPGCGARARARADRPARRRVRLDAERADARTEGCGALRQPVARTRVPGGRVPRAVRAPLRLGRPARPVPRAPAARAPVGDRARRLGRGARAAAASRGRSTSASRRRSRRATSRCAAARLDRALDFLAVLRP